VEHQPEAYEDGEIGVENNAPDEEGAPTSRDEEGEPPDVLIDNCAALPFTAAEAYGADPEDNEGDHEPNGRDSKDRRFNVIDRRDEAIGEAHGDELADAVTGSQ